MAYWWGFTYNDVVPECYIITIDGLESEPFADVAPYIFEDMERAYAVVKKQYRQMAWSEPKSGTISGPYFLRPNRESIIKPGQSSICGDLTGFDCLVSATIPQGIQSS